MTASTSTSSATPRLCPQCHLPLPPSHAGAAKCPSCLLDLALQSAATTAGPTPPSIAELQPLFPEYELMSLLGRGGMGAVYKARQRRLDRIVALKVMLPQPTQEAGFRERFDREARALARLSHPGIVGIHDLGQAGTYCYLVLEFVDGANLRDLLQEGPLTARDVLAWVPQLCDALQYAHDHRIVHRDIKPENILIDGDGRVRIADFGLARLLGDDPRAGLSLSTVGTPHYMAPEQVIGSPQVDHRADLYSLGVVLYEMLTGQLPIGRFGPPSNKAATARPFDAVAMKSLAAEPEERYQHAREIKSDVAATAGRPRGRRVHDDDAPRATTERTPRQSREFPLYAVFAVVIIAAAQFMTWLRIEFTRTAVPAGLEHLVGGQHFYQTGDGWQTTIGIVPAWFTLVAALVAAALCVRRHLGHHIPAGSILIATSVALILIIYFALHCNSSAEAEIGFGAILTALVLLAWNTLELRRMGEASSAARRLAAQQSGRR